MSRELFDQWADNPRNGLIIADFAVAGTMARQVLDSPPEVLTRAGLKVQTRVYVTSVPTLQDSQNRPITSQEAGQARPRLVTCASRGACRQHVTVGSTASRDPIQVDGVSCILSASGPLLA